MATIITTLWRLLTYNIYRSGEGRPDRTMSSRQTLPLSFSKLSSVQKQHTDDKTSQLKKKKNLNNFFTQALDGAAWRSGCCWTEDWVLVGSWWGGGGASSVASPAPEGHPAAVLGGLQLALHGGVGLWAGSRVVGVLGLRPRSGNFGHL